MGDLDAGAPLVAGVAGATASRPRSSLYRVVWRWHFYAGLLVSPVLFVVAVTGAIYVFKDELSRVLYRGVMFVSPQAGAVSLERQVAAVEDAFPGWRADTVEIDADPTRATSVRVRAEGESRRVYVDPHTGAALGSIGDESFFRVVLAIHRRLFIGTAGRVVVELVTCWTIVLLVTGLYLWFPRRREKLRGVLVPRLRARPYTVLRDLHAIVGAFLVPVALTVAGTGLVYSLVWGNGYRYATDRTGGPAAIDEVPRSTSPPGSPSLPLDRAVAIVREHAPGASMIDLRLPAKPGDTLGARARFGEPGPRGQITLAIDRSTGSVIDLRSSDQYPALRWWRTTWNYPLHVGSVLGTPTKVIWLIACLALAAMPVTGLWMWWERRPEGRTGFTRRPDRRVPWWLIGVIALLSVLLPAVGASILLILAGEWLVDRGRWRSSTPRPSPV